MQPIASPDWQATRAQTGLATQLLARDGDDDVASDVGRRIDDAQRELFVSCAPAEAMQQQFERLKPEYVAVHDVGTQSSRRFVAGLASALGTPVQKLAIRRHGAGVGLATIEFVELPVDAGPPLRVYSTEIEAATQQRHELAHVLLAYSRLGVLMVGDLPSHALEAALKPLGDAIVRGPWSNQQLLVLPLASASTLAPHASALGLLRSVDVRITPQVMRPNDAWNYLCSTWDRLRERLLADGAPALPAIGALAPTTPAAAPAPPAPLPMRPMPAIPGAASSPVAAPVPPPLPMRPMPPIPAPPAQSATPPAAAVTAVPAPRDAADERRFERYVAQLIEIKGMVSACVFEPATQRSLAHAGARPGPAMLSAQGAALAGAMLDASKALGFGNAAPEAVITLAGHHLLLRPLPGRPALLLHAVLDRSAANLTLARLQVLRLDELIGLEA